MRTRFLSLLCVLALCLTLLPATAGAAGAGPDWTYDPEAQTLTSGSGADTVTLNNVTASGTELTIGKNGSNSSGPMFNDNTLDLSGTITGTDGTPQYTITSIGDSAFYRCESLTSITLPEGTTSIGNSAFFRCTSLTSVDLSLCTNLASIGDSAFYGCESLTSVDLSRCTNLPSIGKAAFMNCTFLTSITLPESVISIGESAFFRCNALTSVTLPENVTSIGEYAFSGCASLASVDLSRCTNLTSIHGIFNGCTALTSITLPEGVTFIGEYAFSGCASLPSVDLSRCTNLTSIGGYAFSHCNALTSIALPESVTSIGECAFQNCKELTSMSLLSKTPPTLGHYALKFFVREQDGTYPSFNLPKLTILVPLGSVEAYQAASGWSDYTGKIQAIPGTAAIACSPSSLTMTVGDTPSAITVTLTNTGMVELTNLAAALTGSGANAFTLDTLSVPSLAAGTSTTFLLTPRAGLAVGTYPVTVQVTSENLTAPVTASFTLTVTEPYVPPEDNSDPSYSVSLPGKVTGGTVTAKKSYGEEDETFRFAVTPDEGYELASLAVTDSRGRELDLEYEGSGEYSFKMPDRQVEIEVSFRAVVVEPEPLPFTDVADNAWYAEAVRYVYEHGLMAGTSATAFSPDATTSRSMIAAILWRMAGSPVVDYAMDFADVAQGQWYSEAIRWAASEGIVSGYGDAFGINDPITREQVALMLWNYAGKPAPSGTLPAYPDRDKVSSWAVHAMTWCTEKGILSNLDGTLSPQGNATRAQAAVMLMQFAQQLP